jgi:hypothetical protein
MERLDEDELYGEIKWMQRNKTFHPCPLSPETFVVIIEKYIS